jgi:putative nucleotidyltransferase with HDIG domain
MTGRFDIMVLTERLFEEIQKNFSTFDTFTAHDECRFVVDGLRFIRAQGKNNEFGLGHAGFNWGRRIGKPPVAFLDEEYERLRDYSSTNGRIIWLNSEGRLAPGGEPKQDVDVLTIKDLLNDDHLLEKPTLRQCEAWWDEWDVPNNVRRHAKTVAWGAYVLAVMMRNRGIQIDPILTHRGGLLHDIDKIKTLNEDGQHGQMGAEFLLREGYPAAAEIIREHIMHRIMHPGAEDLPWEVKLVYFVDKLVEGDQIVSFDKRLARLKERYPGYRGAMARAESHIWALSDGITSILSISDHEKLIMTLRKLQYN